MISQAALFNDVFITPGIYFIRESVEGLNAANIGYEMAVELSQVDLHSPSLPMVAKDCLCELLDKSIQTLGNGRKILAISNTSILFEPQLALNVEAILRSYARSLPVVFETTGRVENDQYLPFADNEDIKVDLTNLKYTKITK